MFRLPFTARHLVGGLVLTALLALAMALVVSAQSPDNGGPNLPGSMSNEVYEEDLVGAQPGTADRQPMAAPGEPAAGADLQAPTAVEEVESVAAPTLPTAQFFRFTSANTFVPYDDNMTYNYYGAGCVYRTGGASFSEQTLQLPDGAEIDFMRVYFYDNDAVNNAGAHLFSFDGAGSFTTIASATSSGQPGQSSTGSGFFSHVVDNTNRALSLRLDYGGGTTSNLRICGVRIRYQYSFPAVNLPIINKPAP